MEFFILGILFGLLSATVTESVGHKLTGHPNAFQRKLYLKYPRLFHAFLKPYYQHLVIHHHRTFKGNFFDQFKDQLEKDQLDRWIERKFSKEFKELIWIERYNLTLKGISGTLPFAIPFMLGPLLIYLTFGSAALLGSLLTAFIPVWLSKFVHPLVHLPHETADAHPFVKWLMRTKYMRHVFRNHYLHHQHMETNFNLLLGGDYLVGLHKPATAEENLELEQLTAEFDRRVRLESSSDVETPSLTNRETSPVVSIQEFIAEEQNYVSLKSPNFEQRFQHMKWKSQAYASAEAHGNAEILKFRDEGRIDYGMHLYQKDISFQKWASQPEFSVESYVREGSSVLFRGVKFEVGDLLLTNQACDSDGLFSTLLKEDISFAHIAMFCMLEHEGKQFPAVIEINELGVRAVPLKVLASDRFNTYIEIIRLNSPVSEEVKTKLGKAAFEMMSEVHAFDIYQDETQKRYLNCARTVAELYRNAGLEALEATSVYHPKTIQNLKFLGIEACADKTMLMPDDFLRSPDFRIVGSIDNGKFEDVLARGMIRGRIQEIWRTQNMTTSNFPLEYYVNRFVVNGIQTKTWYSPLLLRLAGFDQDHFPSGPLMFICMIPTTNRLMKVATRALKTELLDRWNKVLSANSWHDLINDKEIAGLILETSKDFAGLYNSSEQVVSLNLNLMEQLEANEPKQKSV